MFEVKLQQNHDAVSISLKAYSSFSLLHSPFLKHSSMKFCLEFYLMCFLEFFHVIWLFLFSISLQFHQTLKFFFLQIFSYHYIRQWSYSFLFHLNDLVLFLFIPVVLQNTLAHNGLPYLSL
jgi:hypothetical protein